MILRIMTYNIQGGREMPKPYKYNYDGQCDVIRELNPDILGLNEVGKSLPEGVTSHVGYYAKRLFMNSEFYPALDISGGPYGNAQLSKYPLTDARTLHIPDPERTEDAYYEHRCIGVSRVMLPDGRGIKFITSHFGLAKGEQRNAVKTLCDELDRTDGPVIVMGDFNTTPDDEILAPIYARLNSVDDDIPTFDAENPDRKIDYIFVSNEFTVHQTWVHMTQASDHLPLICDVEI